MALGNWLTNRGKKSYLTTAVHGSTNFFMGLLQGAGGAPTGLDTEAEVQDLNTFTELDAVTGVTDSTAARVNMTSVTVTEDDTNNRANLDAANVTFPTVAAGAEIYGGYMLRGTGVDGDDLVQVFVLKDSGSGTGITPNGSDIVATVSDFARAA